MTGAILLAGGRGSRMGGVTKPLLTVGESTLLQRAVHAVSGCEPITIVGPEMAAIGAVSWVREEPPFGGPVAAIAAALESWRAGRHASRTDPVWTAVVACDLPGVEEAVEHIESAIATQPTDVDGVCLVDGRDRAQWLLGAYRTEALRTVIEELPAAGQGCSMRSVVESLRVILVHAPESMTFDIDTWDDLAHARDMINHNHQGGAHERPYTAG